MSREKQNLKSEIVNKELWSIWSNRGSLYILDLLEMLSHLQMLFTKYVLRV